MRPFEPQVWGRARVTQLGKPSQVRAYPFDGLSFQLVFPAELEAGLGQGVVADLGAGVALGQVGGVGGQLAVMVKAPSLTDMALQDSPEA
jgi:hypothetical protein